MSKAQVIEHEPRPKGQAVAAAQRQDVSTEPAAMMGLVERASKDPNVDIDKLEFLP